QLRRDSDAWRDHPADVAWSLPPRLRPHGIGAALPSPTPDRPGRRPREILPRVARGLHFAVLRLGENFLRRGVAAEKCFPPFAIAARVAPQAQPGARHGLARLAGRA